VTLRFETMVSPFLDERCYALWDEGKAAALLDPGVGADQFLARVRALALDVKAIYQSHCHFDHCASAPQLIRDLKAAYFIGPGEERIVEELPERVRMFGIQDVEVPGEWQFVRDGDTVRVGNAKAVVLHTPGHTPGSVCYWFEHEKLVFTGDTLFRGSVGRTDFPGGSTRALLQSLKKLTELPDETKVLPGHGMASTIGHEKQTNPFLRPEGASLLGGAYF